MNFSLVTETFPPEVNGVAMTLDRLVQGLHRLNVKVTVITPRREDRDLPASCRLVQVRGIPIPQYPSLRLGLPSGRMLEEAWRKEPPNLVHVATEGLLGWSALRAAQRLGLPVISSYHTNFHSYGNHYGFGLFKPVILGWLKAFHNRSLRTFAPSEDVIEALRSEGFQNLRLLGRGVDSELFGPHRRSKELRKSWGADSDTPVALYVGRLAPEKNLPLLIRAYHRLRSSLPTIKLVIVGDGPERSRLQKSLPSAQFCGSQRSVSLARHYASADCFLFPSTSETFGNVVTEALGSGLPVLAFDYAAPRRFIESGCNGILAPYKDEDAFIAAAGELASLQRTWKQMGKAAREAILPCTWNVVIQSFFREVQSVLQTDTERQTT